MKKIYFNPKVAEVAIRYRQAFYDRVNELSAKLREEAVTLTSEILGEIMNKGIPYIASLLIQEGAKQYERAGIRVTSVILGGLDQASRATAARFEKYLLPLRQAQQQAHISWAELSINADGEAVFTDTERKEIEKQFSVFLKKEDEPTWTKLNEIAEFLNHAAAELKEEADLDLLRSLRAALAENSYIVDENHKRHPRPDICLLLTKEDKIEANPVIFG